MDEIVTIDGIKVRYDVEGTGDPILLIHGPGVGRSIWKQFISEASGMFKVYAIDLPGFGNSDAPKDLPYSIGFYVDFLLKFMNELGISKANVTGSSMGGMIVADMASIYPHRVTKIALIAPAGLSPMRSKFSSISRRKLRGVSFWLMSINRGLFRKFYEDFFYDRKKIPEGLVNEAWGRMKDPGYRKALMKNSLLMAARDDQFEESLSSIKSRTLIMWGAEDRIVPVADADRFSSSIKRSEVKILENCGHMVLADQGELCTKSVLTFFGQVDLYYANEEVLSTG
ncbi:MAG TPA: alpha/beta hydrolase [Methanocella sp.]|nr:alpha/beta hydrolase [Methanocella sp.]